MGGHAFKGERMEEKLKEQIERYKTIAYNAILESQIEERMSHEDVLMELGITEEEYKEIME